MEKDEGKKGGFLPATIPVMVNLKFLEVQREKREKEEELHGRQEELKEVDDKIEQQEIILKEKAETAMARHSRAWWLLYIFTPIMVAGGGVLAYAALESVYYGRKLLAGVGAVLIGVGGFLGVETLLYFLEKTLSPRAFLRFLKWSLAIAIIAFFVGLGFLHDVRGLQGKANTYANLESGEDVDVDESGKMDEGEFKKVMDRISWETSAGMITAGCGIEYILGVFVFRMWIILDKYKVLAKLSKRRRWLKEKILKLRCWIAGHGGMGADYFGGAAQREAAWENNYGKPLF